MDRINSASHIDKLAAHTSQGCEWKKYQGFSSEQIPGVVSQNHNLQQCAKNLRNLSVQKHTPTNIEGTQVDTIFFDSVPKIDVETRFRKEVMNGWCWKKKVWIMNPYGVFFNVTSIPLEFGTLVPHLTAVISFAVMRVIPFATNRAVAVGKSFWKNPSPRLEGIKQDLAKVGDLNTLWCHHNPTIGGPWADRL